MDRIIVKSNADMQRVLDWSAELRGLAVELPFSEGEIEFQEEGFVLRFRDEGAPVVGFEMVVAGRVVVAWESNMDTLEIPELHLGGSVETKMQLGSLILKDDTIGKCVRKFRGLMLFAAYYREEVKKTRTVRRVAAGGGSGKRSQKRMLSLRSYTIGGEMLSELPAPGRVWKGYAESFGVRGHYRHYKSGKVSWVRPYEKHGRSEKRGDKEYIL